MVHIRGIYSTKSKKYSKKSILLKSTSCEHKQMCFVTDWNMLHWVVPMTPTMSLITIFVFLKVPIWLSQILLINWLAVWIWFHKQWPNVLRGYHLIVYWNDDTCHMSRCKTAMECHTKTLFNFNVFGLQYCCWTAPHWFRSLLDITPVVRQW